MFSEKQLQHDSKAKAALKHAFNGNPQAQFEIGYTLYLKPESKEMGLAWLKKAASAGHAMAREILDSSDCNELRKSAARDAAAAAKKMALLSAFRILSQESR